MTLNWSFNNSFHCSLKILSQALLSALSNNDFMANKYTLIGQEVQLVPPTKSRVQIARLTNRV